MKYLKLKTQFGLLIAGVLLLVTSISVSTFMDTRYIQEEARNIFQNQTGPALLTQEVDYLTQRNRLLLSEMLLQPNSEVITKKSRELYENERSIHKILEDISSQATSEAEVDLLHQINNTKTNYENNGFLRVLTALSEGRSQGLIGEYNQKIVPLGEAYHAKLRTLVDSKKYNTTHAIGTMMETMQKNKIRTVAIGATVLGLLMALTIPMTSGIIKPIRYAANIAQNVAEGDLQQDISVVGNNEISSLKLSLKEMQRNLSNLVHKVRDTSYSVAKESESLKEKNDYLRQRAELQLEAVANAMTCIEKLVSINQSNTESALRTRTLSDQANGSANQGGAVVEQAIIAMRDIESVAHQIKEITAVLNGIAFQTNILALNAAVEAAHAGPQGRGFAVVATEVRLLAQKAAASASEIQELIDTSHQRIAQGAELVRRAGQSMVEIVRSSKNVNDLTVDICALAEEQGAVIKTTHAAIDGIGDIATWNSNLVIEMTQTSTELKNQSLVLIELVDFFKPHNADVELPATS